MFVRFKNWLKFHWSFDRLRLVVALVQIGLSGFVLIHDDIFFGFNLWLWGLLGGYQISYLISRGLNHATGKLFDEIARRDAEFLRTIHTHTLVRYKKHLTLVKDDPET